MTQESADGPWDWSVLDPSPGSIAEAIEAGGLEGVKHLLDEHSDYWLRYRDPILKSMPLHASAGINRADIAELLIRRGADLDPRDYQSMTPLHWAAQNACVDVIGVLVRSGANIEAVDSSGLTPLVWTSLKQDPDHRKASRLLLDLGARLDLLSSLALRMHETAGRMLMNDPEIVYKTPAPELLLRTAVRLIQKEIWDRAGLNGEDKDAVDAVIAEHLDILEMLIVRGAPMSRSFEALRWALELPHPAAAELLIKAGANAVSGSSPDVRQEDLLEAAERSPRRDEMIAMLRKYGIGNGGE